MSKPELINACDPLTGLMTSPVFMKKLKEESKGKAAGTSTFIALVNLDRFKAINRRYGRAIGNAVLEIGAQRITTSTHAYAEVARLGGDVFGLLFSHDVRRGDVEVVAQRILASFSLPFVSSGSNVFVGVSIGLAEYTNDLSVSEVLRRADKALHLAKDLGRGCSAWYAEEMERRAIERVEIESDLRSAIKNASIEPWFQPIVALEDNSLTGFEVLARWENEKNWWVPPLRFIETAEQCGLIDTLSLSLFKKACMHAIEWDSNLTISFNISPHQFRDPNLFSNITQVLDESGFDPKRLTLEITESAVIHNIESARAKLEAFKSFGIEIALDDFGTGFSSLSNLGHLPIDRIKIDRSFITNIQENPHNQKIVKGILALARGLGVEVTVEGVESNSDLELLKMLGCTLGQGFLFHRAIPAAKVASFLATKWHNKLVSNRRPENRITICK